MVNLVTNIQWAISWAKVLSEKFVNVRIDKAKLFVLLRSLRKIRCHQKRRGVSNMKSIS